MIKIEFEDAPSTNTPITASNLNLLQENVENGIHPIGSVYVSPINQNPEQYFGGTWEAMPYRQLIEKGVVDGKNYEKYSDGYMECWGQEYLETVIKQSSSVINVTLPASYNGGYNVQGTLNSGGAYYANVAIWANRWGNEQIRINFFNNSLNNNAQNLYYGWRTCGYYTDTPTLFAWKRTE